MITEPIGERGLTCSTILHRRGVKAPLKTYDISVGSFRLISSADFGICRTTQPLGAEQWIPLKGWGYICQSVFLLFLFFPSFFLFLHKLFVQHMLLKGLFSPY